jgi:DNA-binding MarR family transcriptional regulator
MNKNYGFILETTAKMLKQTLQRRFNRQKIEITVDQWILLSEIFYDQNINQVELCEKVYKDAPTVTRMLVLLQREGYLERVNSQLDKRRFDLKLTTKGQELIKKTLPLVHDFRKDGWRGLDDDDMNHLYRIANKISENLLRG